MRRREFISLVGGAAAWPFAAGAQQPSLPVIGLLGATTEQGYAAQLAAFRQGLSEAGFVEGRDVIIEYRWADDQYDRLPALAADLVRRRVDVIATIGGNASSLAAKVATATIPIVFHGSLDPIKAGFVASLNRPGGNATGVITLNVDTGQKRLELIHELVPAATTMGLLLNPTNKMVAEIQSKDLQAGARALGLQLRILACEQRTRFRCGVRKSDSDAGRRTGDRYRRLFCQPERKAGSTDGAPFDACYLSISRICCCRRAFELRRQRYGLVPVVRCLYRPRSQGKQAGRPPGPTVHKS